MSNPPRTIRWRDKVLNDPALSPRAKIAAQALARFADVNGRKCYPSAERCAEVMGVSLSTIKRGWSDLKKAGYLLIEPLPPSRRRKEAALKVMLFPSPPHMGSAAPDMGSAESGLVTRTTLKQPPHVGSKRPPISTKTHT